MDALPRRRKGDAREALRRNVAVAERRRRKRRRWDPSPRVLPAFKVAAFKVVKQTRPQAHGVHLAARKRRVAVDGRRRLRQRDVDPAFVVGGGHPGQLRRPIGRPLRQRVGARVAGSAAGSVCAAARNFASVAGNFASVAQERLCGVDHRRREEARRVWRVKVVKVSRFVSKRRQRRRRRHGQNLVWLRSVCADGRDVVAQSVPSLLPRGRRRRRLLRRVVRRRVVAVVVFAGFELLLPRFLLILLQPVLQALPFFGSQIPIQIAGSERGRQLGHPRFQVGLDRLRPLDRVVLGLVRRRVLLRRRGGAVGDVVPQGLLLRSGEPGLLEQDVFGFQVGVDDAAFAVEEVERDANLPAHVANSVDGQTAVLGLSDDAQQVCAQHLEDHADVTAVRPHVLKVVQKLDEPRVVVVRAARGSIALLAFVFGRRCLGRHVVAHLRPDQLEQFDLIQRSVRVVRRRLLHF
mmetsp:Transcript_2061/g.6266  ORF Transcript_2061/g.6266 Transcript_2061/m.6266 type:complete len:463 (-) Transcript_2061:452-1840(-)